MTYSTQFVITFLVSAGITAGATYVVRKLAFAANALDVPNSERKIHTKPMPLWGGLAIFIGVAISMGLIYWLGWLSDDRISVDLLYGVLVAGAMLIVGGMLDDRFSLSWAQQLVFPCIAVIIMLISGLEISFVTNPFGEGLLYLDKTVGLIFLVIWILGMIYTTKLLDGVDGLTSSISLVASVIIFIVSLSWDTTGSTTSFLALAVAGSALGFLFWNWHPAKIFLGEGGSVFFGFMLAVLAVISGGKIATALLVMGIPILDVAWIIIRRMSAGKKVFSADTQHLHFRLLQLGMSQRQVVLFLSLLSVAFGSVAFFVSTRGKIVALAILFLVMVLIGLTVVKSHERRENTHS